MRASESGGEAPGRPGSLAPPPGSGPGERLTPRPASRRPGAGPRLSERRGGRPEGWAEPRRWRCWALTTTSPPEREGGAPTWRGFACLPGADRTPETARAGLLRPAGEGVPEPRDVLRASTPSTRGRSAQPAARVRPRPPVQPRSPRTGPTRTVENQNTVKFRNCKDSF